MPLIRPYQHKDWDDFIKLDLEVGHGSMKAASPGQLAEFQRRWPEQLRSLYQWTEDGPTFGNSLLLVLQSDQGEYAGHLWLTEQVDFFTTERKLYITTVALVPACRGQGFGKLLMRRAEEEARMRGLTRIGLGVDATNDGAIALYSRLGYQITRLAMEFPLTSGE